MASLDNRTLLVTGGNAGIGAAITHALLAGGARVVNVSRRTPDFADERLVNILGDLSDPADLPRISAEVTGLGITGFVHNAGVIRPALLGDVQDEDFDHLVNLHLRAAIHLAQALLPSMAAAGNGRIVLISSRGALGLQGRTAYAATKAGMIGMARTWALELAGQGVTVNVVSPGPIETDMFHDLIPDGSDHKRRVAASIPVGRVGTTDDVAAAVRFFLSSEASFVTGQNLFVCGGASIGSIVL